MISKKNTIKAVIILLFIAFGGILFALMQYNKPHTDVATSKSDMTITAQALYADFEDDEVLANKKYLDQIVEVTGPIANVSEVKGQMIVSVGSGGMMGNVKCHLTPEETAKNYALKEGQMITLKGICTGYLMDVILVKAVLIN